MTHNCQMIKIFQHFKLNSSTHSRIFIHVFVNWFSKMMLQEKNARKYLRNMIKWILSLSIEYLWPGDHKTIAESSPLHFTIAPEKLTIRHMKRRDLITITSTLIELIFISWLKVKVYFWKYTKIVFSKYLISTGFVMPRHIFIQGYKQQNYQFLAACLWIVYVIHFVNLKFLLRKNTDTNQVTLKIRGLRASKFYVNREKLRYNYDTLNHKSALKIIGN